MPTCCGGARRRASRTGGSAGPAGRRGGGTGAPPGQPGGVPILGTSPDAIDRAEDRQRFAALLADLRLQQAPGETARSYEEAERIAEAIGYPVLVRPSYVLGGRAMRIIWDREDLEGYMSEAVRVSDEHPVLVDKFLEDALKVDVDAIADGERVVVGGVMEHIEKAGIHSGDSACALPPYSLGDDQIERIKVQTRALARELGVIGLLNIQFAIKNETVYVLEVNPRASRTVPFVSKAIGVPLAKLATKVMLGQRLADLGLPTEREVGHIAVKESVFPFIKFPGADVVLGPEMKSTGEVMGIDRDFRKAYLKSQVAAGETLPTSGAVFISVKNRDKRPVTTLAKRLSEMGVSPGSSPDARSARSSSPRPVPRRSRPLASAGFASSSISSTTTFPTPSGRPSARRRVSASSC